MFSYFERMHTIANLIKMLLLAELHRESKKKGATYKHGYNFVHSWSICKILSLLQTAVNFQQNSY